MEKDANKLNLKKMLVVVIVSILAIIVIIAGIFWIYPNVQLHTLDNIISKYNENEIEYDAAFARIENLSKSSNGEISSKAKKAEYELNFYKSSHDAYNNGLKQIDLGNYKVAFEQLSRVDKKDYFYENTCKLMNENLINYRAEVISCVDDLSSKKEYASAMKEIESYLKYSENEDAELTEMLNALMSKKATTDAQNKKKQIEKYRKEQLFIVSDAYAYNDGYYIVSMKGTVVVKNKSDKVAKDIRLSILQFDNNGYPVDAKYNYLSNAENEVNAVLDSVNVRPGMSCGSNSYWYLSDNAKQIKACVKSVEYVDGTTWDNPYYSYWLDEEQKMF